MLKFGLAILFACLFDLDVRRSSCLLRDLAVSFVEGCVQERDANLVRARDRERREYRSRFHKIM